MARSRTGQILPEGSRVYVEEQLFRADVEERLFRAVSASAFDCGLQPRPTLKGIHPPLSRPWMPLFHAYASACAPGAKKHPTGRNTDGDQIRGTHPCVRMWTRGSVWKSSSLRADVEERLFRAVSACAFNCGLQPRPALKGIHHPAVAAMNGRSSTLMQALVLRARRSIQTEGSPGAAQVRGNHPCVSNTWRNKEMGQPQSVPVPETVGQPAIT